MSTPPSTAAQTVALLPPFLAQLASTTASIPPDTLGGAITHFLACLPAAELSTFVHALSASPLWSTFEAGPSVRRAVPAKVWQLRAAHARSYVPDRGVRVAARAWLRVLRRADRAEVRVAVLRGLDDVELDWGSERVRLEEDVVLALAEAREGELRTLIPAIPHIHAARLYALDIEALLPRLLSAVHACSSRAHPSDAPDAAAAASRALARALQVSFAGGPASQARARDTVLELCGRVEGAADVVSAQALDSKGADAAVLDAFVLPAQAGIDHLITRPRHDDPVLPCRIIRALSTIPPIRITSTSAETLIHSALDVVASLGATTASALTGDLVRAAETPARAAFALDVAKQLVDSLDATAVGSALRVCETYLYRPDLREAFDASHAFVLALLEAASRAERPAYAQDEFIAALVAHYVPLMMRQHAAYLPSTHLEAAFPVLLRVARPAQAEWLLALLARADLATRVAAVPAVPPPQLQAYLDRLGVDMEAASSAEREPRVDELFKAVMDLADDAKDTGVAWWLRWRRRLGARPAAHL
ncbi:hypothetical protein Q5752_000652 [Cryptotrichosporon argae]